MQCMLAVIIRIFEVHLGGCLRPLVPGVCPVVREISCHGSIIIMIQRQIGTGFKRQYKLSVMLCRS